MKKGDRVFIDQYHIKGIITSVHNHNKTVTVEADGQIYVLAMRFVKLWKEIGWFKRLLLSIFKKSK